MTVLLTLIMLNLRICSFTNPPWTCAVTTLPVRLPLSGEGVGGFAEVCWQRLDVLHFGASPPEPGGCEAFGRLMVGGPTKAVSGMGLFCFGHRHRSVFAGPHRA